MHSWAGEVLDVAVRPLLALFYVFGGMLQIIGAILEWVLGNTIVYVVFGSVGKFVLSEFLQM